jgi:hypothetical protein
MKLTIHSLNKLNKTFGKHTVELEYREIIKNYIIHGFDPGSFFVALFANDAWSAIVKSHNANTMTALKDVVQWIYEYCPKEACGSYEKVRNWCDLSSDDRRSIIENVGLIYTEDEEVLLLLGEK